MAHQNYITPEDLPAENPWLNGRGRKIALYSGTLGVISLLASIALGLGMQDGMERFFYSYQVAFVYTAVITFGALFFVIVFHLTRAQWNIVLRRIAEILASNVWVVAIFAIPSLLGAARIIDMQFMWPWINGPQGDHLLELKTWWLNSGFFLGRLVAYFAFWIFISMYYLRGSVRQDATGDPNITRGFWTASAPAMLLFALTITGFVIDIVMSLDPYWYSTMIGVYFFAGCVLTIMSSLVLITFWLQNHGHLKHAITIEHQHDLGKLMFAFTVFWGYIAFSQYMLIWYSNIPEETQWYLLRQSGQWYYFIWGLLILHLLLPLAGLLSRWVKKNRRFLAFWAVWILIMEWYDLYWLIMPQYQKPATSSGFFETTIPFSILDPLCMIGLVGIFISVAALRAEKHALIPLKDPGLAESLKFENVKV